MWDGTFSPPVAKGSVVNHFKIVSEKLDEVTGMVSVEVVFDKTPGKVYLFEFDADFWDGQKETIANAIRSWSYNSRL